MSEYADLKRARKKKEGKKKKKKKPVCLEHSPQFDEFENSSRSVVRVSGYQIMIWQLAYWFVMGIRMYMRSTVKNNF